MPYIWQQIKVSVTANPPHQGRLVTARQNNPDYDTALFSYHTNSLLEKIEKSYQSYQILAKLVDFQPALKEEITN